MPDKSVLITAIVTLCGMLLTYLGTKSTNKKDLVNANRISLSQDEKDFRSDLLKEIKSYRDEIHSLMAEVGTLRDLNSELKAENELLSFSVKSLQGQVEVLTKALDKFNNGDTSIAASAITIPPQE